jgi:putative transposase
VRAGLVARAEDWTWSSVHAHLAGRSEGLTTVAPVKTRFPSFGDLLALGPDETAFERLRRAESVGRPLGGEAFVAALEAATSRPLRPGKRGRNPVAHGDDEGDLLSALSP